MTTNITPKQALEMVLNGEAILIDVRDAQAYQTEHIVYAASIPLEELEKQITTLKKQPKKIIFQCMVGVKSLQACSLTKNSAENVYNMIGGLSEWKKEGLPTLTAISANNLVSPKISLIRQIQLVLGAILLMIFLIPLLTGYLSFLGYLVPLIGIGLVSAGLSGTCLLGRVLSSMPWNK